MNRRGFLGVLAGFAALPFVGLPHMHKFKPDPSFYGESCPCGEQRPYVQRLTDRQNPPTNSVRYIPDAWMHSNG